MADGGELRLYDAGQQLELVSASIHDARPSVPTGFMSLDVLLRRGGLLPGNFVLLGGRTGTRKSTIAANMMVSMAQANIPVGLVGLDEAPWQYAVDMMSVVTRRSRDWVEQVWDEDEGRTLQRDWKTEYRDSIFLFGGKRPGIDQLNSMMEMASMGDREAPAVIVIDYLKLMARGDDLGWNDGQRLPRLAEELAIWTTETGVVAIVLHQLSRNDEYGNANNRNAGHVPMTLTQLMYGGEDSADIVLGTYRPAMDPIGVMSVDAAKMALGKDFNAEDFYERKALVRRYWDSTFLQLLKNRPGTRREERGVELLSRYADSLAMEEKTGDRTHEVRPAEPEGASAEEEAHREA